MGVSVEYIRQRVDALHEQNPMLGHRGCRLGNTYPEITQMQTRAILGAALELKKEGISTYPEIMVPLTGIVYEFKEQEEVIRAEAEALFAEQGDKIDFKIGTMIEVPRAALTSTMRYHLIVVLICISLMIKRIYMNYFGSLFLNFLN